MRSVKVAEWQSGKVGAGDCYAHVVRRVRELTGVALPASHAEALASGAAIVRVLGDREMPLAGDVVEMRDGGGARHVGVMVSAFECEHLDTRSGRVQRVGLALLRRAGVVARVVRPLQHEVMT